MSSHVCKTKSTAVSEDALAWPSAVQARSNPAYSTSTCASGDCELACKREFVTTFFLFSLWCPSHRVLLFCVGTGPTFGDNLQFAMIASARPFQARASGVRTKVHPLTRQVSLPGRSRLGSTFRSASSRLSKSAPRKRPDRLPMRGGRCVWRRIDFPRESPGRTLAAGRLAWSREQESRALWLGS